MGSATARSHPDRPVSTASREAFRQIFLYSLTVFSSAFLLFEVEPIIGKLILPWFGGAVAVWTVSLLFFQTVLLAGYCYAHLLTQKFQPKVQAWIHSVLLAFSLLVLPIVPPAYLKPNGSEDPAFRVFLVLTVTIGLPFLLLSATSPLLQAWISRSQTREAVSPYRLYALSNAGSLLALLSYPVLVEPRVSNHHQAVLWSVGYAAVAVLCAATALTTRSSMLNADGADSGSQVPDWRLKTLWAALAGCGSALLLSVTTYISQNIAAVPLLWVLPLSLYLVTYIICFEGHNWYRRAFFLRLLVLALATMAYALAPSRGNLPTYVLIPLFCGGLFACCMVCHGELANLKPHPTYLTSFYLLVSLGAAVGAVFVAIVAPHVFTGYYELPIALGLCGVLIQLALQRDRSVVFLFSRHAYVLGFVLVVALCAGLYLNATQQRVQARLAVRNFYGLLRVEDRVAPGVVLVAGKTSQLLDPDPRYRDLINGTIEHGAQFLAGDRRRDPTTYYGPNSGIGLALKLAAQKGPVNAGIVGLGAGTLAAYGRASDHYTFYEINPLVIELANNMFTFLKQSLAQVKVVAGDARLSLERESPQNFDVLAVDAFSSDAIPTHLLTREAFQLYLRHVKSDGLIAVHVSNRFLDLVPVVRAAAQSLGCESLVFESDADEKRAIYRATWVLVGGPEFVAPPELKWSAEYLTSEKLSLWTDDYSSILQAFK
jgi:hypothetical protein